MILIAVPSIDINVNVSHSRTVIDIEKAKGNGSCRKYRFFFHLMCRISKILFNILLMGQGNTTEIAGFRFIDI